MNDVVRTLFRFPTTRPRVRLPRDRGAVVALVVGLIGLAFAVPPVFKATKSDPLAGNKDYSLWYKVGQSVRTGEPLYRFVDAFEIQYMYPPTLAVLVFAPLVGLGYPGFVAALAVVNALTWAGCAFLAPRLAAGDGEPVSAAAALIPAAVGGAYVWDMFHLGQPNLFLLLLMLAAWWAVRHRRPWLAGAAVGLAVAIKAFPLPVVVYFAARRQWAAAAGTVLTAAAVLVVLPAPVRGFDRNWQELIQWTRLVIGDQSGETMSARTSIGYTRRNQSLVSVAHRLLRPVDAGDRAGVPFRVNVADLSPRQAQAVGFGACLALGGVLLWATRLRFAPTPTAEGLEWGMVLTLVILCSPLSYTYFYCWLLPGWAAAVRFCAAGGHPPGARRWAVAGCGLAGLLSASALTEHYDQLLQAWGVTAWGAVVLFLTLAGMRRWIGSGEQR
jgi:hypothetical protein